MTEPTYEILITDLTEVEIRGTDDIPIYVSQPYFERVRVIHPMFTATNHFGKRKSSYTFRSDDVVTTLQIIRDGGEEKEIAKALMTNMIWAEPLMKHCIKLQKRIDKATKSTRNSRATVKTTSKVVKQKTTQKVVESTLKVDLNKNINIKLNNWM